MKGNKNEECNRTDCQQPPAEYYNYSTRKWYCAECAAKINRLNYHEAMQMFGHELCLYLPDTTEVI